LDVENRELKNHSRNNYSTIQINYSYDPEAQCPTWERFIDDITDGAEDRKNILQQMFGYCLTNDNRYQKCFYLLGAGANGKSVLLSILEALIGEDNASHVEIAFLNSDFQRIKLASSMVNICNDIKTDVAGTGSFFKAIVTGDTISGCYKGKDFFDFKPTCKMVFAANGMLNTRDIDGGFLRRICFVNFPIQFVDNPRRRNEKQRDTELGEKLLLELPGILNWALEGIKALRQNKGFTDTADHEQYIKELEIANDPIAAFVDDMLTDNPEKWNLWVSRANIYEEYVSWCKQTNSAVTSARWFWPRLRKKVNIEEKRSRLHREIKITMKD
jgi:putative DNA primase/helicase